MYRICLIILNWMIIQNYILDMINYFFVYWRDYNLFQTRKLWYSIYHCNYQIYLGKNTNSFNFEQLHECVFKWLTNIDRITNTRYIDAYCIKQDWNREYLSSSPVLIGVRVVRSLVFCVIICRSLFVLLAYLSKWHRKNWHYINWKKKIWSLFWNPVKE
jgi:hypothetical protein